MNQHSEIDPNSFSALNQILHQLPSYGTIQYDAAARLWYIRLPAQWQRAQESILSAAHDAYRQSEWYPEWKIPFDPFDIADPDLPRCLVVGQRVEFEISGLTSLQSPRPSPQDISGQQPDASGLRFYPTPNICVDLKFVDSEFEDRHSSAILVDVANVQPDAKPVEAAYSQRVAEPQHEGATTQSATVIDIATPTTEGLEDANNPDIAPPLSLRTLLSVGLCIAALFFFGIFLLPMLDASTERTPLAEHSSHWMVAGRRLTESDWTGYPDKLCVADTARQTATAGPRAELFGSNITVSCCQRDDSGGARPDCVVFGKSHHADYVEAVAFCDRRGYRLCTADELLDQMTQQTGCGFGFVYNWASTACEPDADNLDSVFMVVGSVLLLGSGLVVGVFYSLGCILQFGERDNEIEHIQLS